MAKEKSKKEENFEEDLSFYLVVKKVVVSEKATRMIELENKLVFELNNGIKGKDILKELFSKKFGKTVTKVNILNNINGEKRAIVTFKEKDAASDIASELGVL